MPAIRTACCYCGVGCGIIVERGAGGRLALRGDPDHPANHGRLCSKGRSLLHTTGDGGGTRLLHPEVADRRGAPRRRAGWGEAIARVAEAFAAAIRDHGPDAVGIYASGQCLTEEYYLLTKLAKGCLGTNNLDTNSRLCMSSAVAAYRLALGSDSVPGCYEDLDLADTVLVAGANPAWCHPIAFQRIEARRRAAPGTRLIVVDPRRTPSAAVADLHLKLRPGTDVALFHALGHELLASGACDLDWIAAHCSGWEALRARWAEWPAERAAVVCDVPEVAIRTAASWLAHRRFVSLWTMGLNQSAAGTDKNLALINLSLATGAIGKPGCGPFSLTGQPNAMGGREAGGMANLLPAHRRLDEAADRAAVEDLWGVPRGRIPARPGLSAVELFQAARAGRIKALWIIATNPVASLPAAAGVDEALRACPFVAVQDAYAGDTIPFADVVLPAATWLEKTGTMTNSERRVQLVERLLDPPGEARADWEIIREVGAALGHGPALAFADPAAVYAEHAALSRGTDCDVSGLSHAAIRSARAVQWPVPQAGHPGTPRLFADGRFHHPDGRARLHAPDYEDRSEPRNAEYPLILTTGRLRDHWHTLTRSGLVARLAASEPRPFCEIHPIDAAARGIADGDPVAVRSRRGELRVPARITGDVRPGMVFVPMHWGPRRGGAAGRSNAPTSERLDPVSKEPDLKLAAVQVEAVRPAPRRVAVVGAGAAALALCRELVRLRPEDEVTVFGAEPEAFYNRVALPHLIAGRAAWDDLRAGHPGARVRVLAGQAVEVIDRGRQLVRTIDGAGHPYDVCVLATGSRPAMPWRGPLPRAGVLGLRTRADAEAILAATGPGVPVAIIGAGLLGIELADALLARGCRVTLLQRSERVMGRQLDAVAAGHLAAWLRERGIDLRLGVAPTSIRGSEQPEAVELADGARVPAALVVFAAGTEPETALAAAAGLPAEGGIAVDDRCATADPAVFAIGECARHASGRVGTTPQAQAMAQALAAILRGDEQVRWRLPPAGSVLKVDGLALASVGEVEERPGDEVVTLHDPARRRYQKRVLRRDRLVGAICLGDTAGFPGLVERVASGLEYDDEERAALLAPGAVAAAPCGPLVCSCHQVGADTIRAAVRTHGNDLDRIGAATRAGTGCGSCRPEIIRLLAAGIPSGEIARRVDVA